MTSSWRDEFPRGIAPLRYVNEDNSDDSVSFVKVDGIAATSETGANNVVGQRRSVRRVDAGVTSEDSTVTVTFLVDSLDVGSAFNFSFGPGLLLPANTDTDNFFLAAIGISQSNVLAGAKAGAASRVRISPDGSVLVTGFCGEIAGGIIILSFNYSYIVA